jgi:hypothetical protein
MIQNREEKKENTFPLIFFSFLLELSRNFPFKTSDMHDLIGWLVG